MAEILLFDSVFHDRVTPVSVSTLKPPLGVIGATTETPSISYSKHLYIRLVCYSARMWTDFRVRVSGQE